MATSNVEQKNVKSPTKSTRVLNESAFVLHTLDYSESSVIVELLTQTHGRVSVLAKGAKKMTSRLHPILQTFQLLTVSFSGKNELHTLTGVEWEGGITPLENKSLLYGFYLNELLLKLLAKEDPHETLFHLYQDTLLQLSESKNAQAVLRQFEFALLKAIGFGYDLSVNVKNGENINPEAMYVVDVESGPRYAMVHDQSPKVLGKTLIDMMQANYVDQQTCQQSKLLMRYLLNHHLGGHVLQTRKILMDLRDI